MSIARLAYMPLVTYPDCVPDDSVAAAVGFAASLGHDLHATTFAVEIPNMSSRTGGRLVNVADMIRTVEENSQAQCQRLKNLVTEKAGTGIKADISIRRAFEAATGEAAASEARYFDLVLLPSSRESIVLREFSQAVVFGAGRPAILVPPTAQSRPVRHVAVAWDASRVAARALADAMPLLDEGARVSVLTVHDEKALAGSDIAETLAASLEKRGLSAQAVNVDLGRRTIAEALQEAALDAGAELLVMGGFGHSRVRDFVLGGATKGVFNDLRLPVLLSH